MPGRSRSQRCASCSSPCWRAEGDDPNADDVARRRRSICTCPSIGWPRWCVSNSVPTRERTRWWSFTTAAARTWGRGGPRDVPHPAGDSAGSRPRECPSCELLVRSTGSTRLVCDRPAPPRARRDRESRQSHTSLLRSRADTLSREGERDVRAVCVERRRERSTPRGIDELTAQVRRQAVHAPASRHRSLQAGRASPPTVPSTRPPVAPARLRASRGELRSTPVRRTAWLTMGVSVG